MKDYSKAKAKIDTRDKTFDELTCDKVIGLGGPQLKEYVERIRMRKVGSIHVWEKDRVVFMKQLEQAIDLDIDLSFGDILDAPVDKKALYDLDFCGNLHKFKEHIIKFKDCKQIITVCLRDSYGRDIDDTLDLFLAYRGELRKSIEWNSNNGILWSHSAKYGLRKYRDGAPMLTIYTL